MLHEAASVNHCVSPFRLVAGSCLTTRCSVFVSAQGVSLWAGPTNLTCRLVRLCLDKHFHEFCEQQFPFAGGERLPTGRVSVVPHESLECQLQFGRSLPER